MRLHRVARIEVTDDGGFRIVSEFETSAGEKIEASAPTLKDAKLQFEEAALENGIGNRGYDYSMKME